MERAILLKLTAVGVSPVYRSGEYIKPRRGDKETVFVSLTEEPLKSDGRNGNAVIRGGSFFREIREIVKVVKIELPFVNPFDCGSDRYLDVETG